MVLEVSLRFFSSPLLWSTFLWKAGNGTGDYLPQIKGRTPGFIFQIWSDIIHLEENFMDGKNGKSWIDLTNTFSQKERRKQARTQTNKSSTRLWLDNFWQNFGEGFASLDLENWLYIKKTFLCVCLEITTLISLAIGNSFSVEFSGLDSGLNFHCLKMNLFPRGPLGFFHVSGVRIRPLLS